MENNAKQMVKQAREQIIAFMAEEKWSEAHRACLEILRFDPDNIKIIKLKSKIEKNVARLNRKAIENDLVKLEPLWKEKKYDELLIHFKELEPYINDYPPLRKQILKAQNLYSKDIASQSEKQYQEQKSQILNLINTGKFEEAHNLAEKIISAEFNKKDVKLLITSLKSKWVDSELQKSQALLETEKYEDILLFYQRLLRIDPTSEKIKKRIKKTKELYEKYKINQRRELIYKNFEKMKTLYQLKKYETALEIANENLSLDPDNKNIKKFIKRAEAKNQHNLTVELAKQIKNSHKQMKEERKKDPKHFVKI